MSRFPDFIIIGAGKCGTTSLHDYLAQHPQLYICPKKETYFFLEPSIREKFKKWGAVTNLEEYLSLFKDAPSNRVIGEISTNYYAYPESAPLIHEAIPSVKIIAILRDPAERAYSSYQMFVRNGHEKQEFSQLISADNHYVERGFYYSELLPFFKAFDRSQIKILLYDDLCKDAVVFMQDLFQYIGVDPQFVPDMSKRGREGGLPKNQMINTLLVKQNPVRATFAALLKPFLPLELRQRVRSQLVKKNIYKSELSVDIRRKLVNLYRNDILRLQDLIDRDLSAWLQEKK